MKIGILTYFGDLNPGTNLQAYCLFKCITELFKEENAKVEIINYHSFKRHLIPFMSSISPMSLYKDIIRINKFKKFQRGNFKYSKPYLLDNNYNVAKQYISKLNYDIIYIGSDTLLELQHADKNGVTIFWLPEEIRARKVMIAASARDTQFDLLTVYQKQKLKESINNIDIIGVRDDATMRLMQSLSENKEILKVPDPTFSLAIDTSHAVQYLKKRKISKIEKLICIHLTRHFAWGKEFATIARKHGYKIVSLRPCYFADYEFNDLGPLEYAGIFKFFKGVITYRFHDTVFSLKNLTPVLTAMPFERYANQFGESKYSALLKEFELYETSYIHKPNSALAHKIFSQIINAIETYPTEKINNILISKKESFCDFIIKSK